MDRFVHYGNVPVLWDDSYKQFDYQTQPLKPTEIAAWYRDGYCYDNYAGKMYDSRNPMPDWTEEIARRIGLRDCGFVLYLMNGGTIMPPHTDHFETYCDVFDKNIEDVFRAVVFLEDWKPGHYFEIDKNGIVNWQAGDYFFWSHDVEHAASNIGNEDRYTLQITGVLP